MLLCGETSTPSLVYSLSCKFWVDFWVQLFKAHGKATKISYIHAHA